MSGLNDTSSTNKSVPANTMTTTGGEDISYLPTGVSSEKTQGDHETKGIRRLVSRLRNSMRRGRNTSGANTRSPEDKAPGGFGCFGSFGDKIKPAKAQQVGSAVSKAPRPKPKKNRKVAGTVLFDTKLHSELWYNVLDNSLMGSGMLEKACFCSRHSGAIFACAPQDFTPSRDQVQNVVGLIEARLGDLKPVDSAIFAFGVDKFDLLEVTTTGVLRARGQILTTSQDTAVKVKGKAEGTKNLVTWPMIMLAMLTKASLLVGIYPDVGAPNDQAEQLLNEVKTYLEEQNV